MKLVDYTEFFEQECKSLPRKETGGFAPFFDADGKKFKIRSASEGVPIMRWTAYEKLNLMFGYNSTIDKLHKNMQKTKSMTNEILLQKGDCKHSIVDVLQHQDSILKGLFDFSHEKVNKALYLCTIFIVMEGEDINNWDKGVAEAKINHWIKEGLDITDFFHLAAIFSPEWSRIIGRGMGNG